MRVVLQGLAGLGLLGTGLSFAGMIHPAGDSLAVFRVPIVIATALLVIWSDWPRRVRWPLALMCLSVLGWHGWMLRAAPLPGTGVTVYQKNLLFVSGNKGPLLDDIARTGADVVTLQEVSGRNREVLDRLRPSYPAQHFCRFGTVGGVAVAARWPVVEGSRTCVEGQGLAAMQVTAPEGDLWVVSLHLHWPWPHGQATQVARLEPVLEELSGPLVLGGDFNAVAWSNTLRRVARASRARRIGPHTPSFRLPKLGMWIGIDHVLSTGRGRASAEIRPRLGSDHRGVVARVQPFSE